MDLWWLVGLVLGLAIGVGWGLHVAGVLYGGLPALHRRYVTVLTRMPPLAPGLWLGGQEFRSADGSEITRVEVHVRKIPSEFGKGVA